MGRERKRWYDEIVRIFISLIAIFIVGATATQLYKLQVKKMELTNELAKVSGQVADFEKENTAIELELAHLEDKERLVREAKAQFNYASPGEKLIIVVPKKQ